MMAPRLRRAILPLLCSLVWVSNGIGANPKAEPDSSDVLAHALNTMHPSPQVRDQALDFLVGLQDPRLIPFLIDLLRSGLLETPKLESSLKALSRVGEPSGWLEWSQWLTAQSIEQHPAYKRFKRELLGLMDPTYRALLDPQAASAVGWEEITWSDLGSEELTPLTLPARRRAKTARDMRPEDLVVGIVVDGMPVAYPVLILEWHPVVNDVIGKVPLVVTYCPYSRTAAVYRAQAGERPRQFAPSGLVVRNNLVMVDVQAGSLWQQMTGHPILGPDYSQGLYLEPLPSTLTTWRVWTRSREKGQAVGEVLSFETGFYRPYRASQPYWAQQDPSRVHFPLPPPSKRLAPAEQVFGTLRGERAKVYPVNELRKKNVANDSLGDINLVVVFDPDSLEVRAFLRGEREFAAAGPSRLKDAAGEEWRVTDGFLISEDRTRRLPRIAGWQSQWMSWASFHPDSEVYTSSP